jgi:hypothetical protein
VETWPLASFEAFMTLMFQVEVFWVVTPCSVAVGYRRFRGPCCLRLKETKKMEAAGPLKLAILSQHFMVSHPRRPRLDTATCFSIYRTAAIQKWKWSTMIGPKQIIGDLQKISAFRISIGCWLLYVKLVIYEGVTKSFRTGRLEQELQMVQLSATRCSCIAILWVRLVSFSAIKLCVISQRVFVISVYFVMTQYGNFWIHPCSSPGYILRS